MSCLCIGGVCIPYAGLIPLLLLALQWVAAQLAKVGLLPDFLAKRLGLNNDCSSGATSSSCCGENKEIAMTTQRRRTARESSTASTANTTDVDDNNDEDEKKDDDEISSNNVSAGGGGEIEHIDTLTRWSDVFTKSKQPKNNNSASLLLFVKFTAEWCKPCKVIQPTYIEMAGQYPKEKFVTVDVDGDDCDVLSSKLRVAMMPTFICFRNGTEIGRMSGGNNPENLKSWVEKMMTAS
jgi:thioredoxin 1